MSDTSQTHKAGPAADVLLVHDPLCGWCFGSIQETNRLADLLDAHGRSWALACGGLVTGDRVRPIGRDADYLRAGLVAVERTTGQRAGRRYFDEVLARGAYVSDSEPLVRLLDAVRSSGPRQQLRLGHHLSSALYRLGLEPTEPDVILHGLLSIGIDPTPVLDDWHSDVAIARTREWMLSSRALGAQVYPSVLLRGADGTYKSVSSGFEPAASVMDSVRRAESGS